MMFSKPVDLIFYGGPAAGKGTQSKIIADKLGAERLEMGHSLRTLANQDSPLGREVKDIIEQGKLVPNEISSAIAENFVLEVDAEKRLIIDGFPRTVVQAQSLDRVMAEKGRKAVFLVITIPDSVALQRLRARAEVENRIDDLDEAAVQERINIFKRQVGELADYYQQDGRFVEIDGTPEVEQVTKDILEAIDGLN